MAEFFTYNDKKIRYQIRGEGRSITLIHGYLENMTIWDSLAEKLARKYEVLVLDVPGHGESETFADEHSMEELAKRVKALLEFLGKNKSIVLGHSMGGYISLAFAELYPEMVDGFGLIHSHPFADKEETKQNRLREIELVKEGKKDLLVNTSIPRGFAEKNLEKFAEQIEENKRIAAANSKKGIIALLNGMRNRKDRSSFLWDTEMSFLFIAGKYDNYIPFDAITRKVLLPENSLFTVLNDSGHMGFMEEETKTVQTIQGFVNFIG